MDQQTIADLLRRGQEDRRHAALQEMANALNAYHKALVQGGMDEGQAFLIISDYHRMVMAKAIYPEDSPYGEGE